MTQIEQLSEKIVALAAECKAVTGSKEINMYSTGPSVHLSKLNPLSVDMFAKIDAPITVRPNNEYYHVGKSVGGVEYFMLLEAKDLGIERVALDVTGAAARYFEAKTTKEAS